MQRPPFCQFNGHLQTIIPSLFRKIIIPYKRERLELTDGDFLDLDWHLKGSKKLVIVTHGLEGNSHRPYVTGMLKLFGENGFDGLGWNCRSCSGEINRLPRFYHHGDAEDLRAVVEHAINKGYEEIFLSGGSMGGSLTLRLLAEFPEKLPKQVIGALVNSVPLDIYSSVQALDTPNTRFYMNRFIRKLHVKMQQKALMFPENPLVQTGNYSEIKNFVDFDGRYTAPLHGYADAFDFYDRASTKPLLNEITVPTLIIQAVNDPFLGKACLEAPDLKNPLVKLEVTPKGGHVGFMESGQFYTYTERKALQFYKKIEGKS